MEFVREEKKQAKRGNLDMKILEKLRDLKHTFSKEWWSSVSNGEKKICINRYTVCLQYYFMGKVGNKDKSI